VNNLINSQNITLRLKEKKVQVNLSAVQIRKSVEMVIGFSGNNGIITEVCLLGDYSL